MEAAVIAGLCSYHCKQNPFVQGFGAVGVPTKLTDAAHSYKRVNYVDSKVFVFVCVWTSVAKSESTEPSNQTA